MACRKGSTKRSAAEEGTDICFQTPVMVICSHWEGAWALLPVRWEQIWQAMAVKGQQDWQWPEWPHNKSLTRRKGDNELKTLQSRWVSSQLPQKMRHEKTSQKKINENSRFCYEIITLLDRCLQKGFCRNQTVGPQRNQHSNLTGKSDSEDRWSERYPESQPTFFFNVKVLESPSMCAMRRTDWIWYRKRKWKGPTKKN